MANPLEGIYNVTLYQGVPFVQDDNFILDYQGTTYSDSIIAHLEGVQIIGRWLNTKVIKIDKEIELKLPVNTTPDVNISGLKLYRPMTSSIDGQGFYVDIWAGSQESGVIHYFVTKFEWLSNYGIKLHLSMDVLNTFKLGKHYKLTNRTRITRKHKDRFTVTSTTGTSRELSAVVDLYPENLNITKCNDKKYTVDITEANSIKWFLVYKSSGGDVEQPISAYLYPSKRITVRKLATPGMSAKSFNNWTSLGFTAGTFPKGNFSLLITYDDNYSVTCTSDDGKQYTLGEGSLVQITCPLNEGINSEMIVSYRYSKRGADGKISTSEIMETVILNNDKGTVAIGPVQQIRFYKPTLQMVTDNGLWQLNPSPNNYMNAFTAFYYDDAPFNAQWFNTIDSELLSIDELDRNDANISTIIALPLPPTLSLTQVASSDGYYLITNTGVNDVLIGGNGLLKLKNSADIGKIDYDLKSTAYIYSHNDTTDTDFDNILYVNSTRTINLLTARTEDRLPGMDDLGVFSDPKFLNSEFSYCKFYYDAFSYIISPERYTSMETLLNDIANISFKVTSTMNSKFLFKFTTPDLLQVEDFEGYLVTSRNNELAIFSDAYYNYLKTGYNYDIKNKELAFKIGVTETVMQAGKSVASTAIGLATFNPTSVAIGLEQGLSAINQGIKTGLEQEKLQNQINRKIAESTYQATNVIGSDDYDLMKEYAGNNLKFAFYRPYDIVIDYISDYFHYYGYACNVIQSFDLESDVVNSRFWFNFIQAEIEFEFCLMSNEMKADLVSRYASGVTFLHGYNSQGLVQFDFSQTHENYEVSVLQ